MSGKVDLQPHEFLDQINSSGKIETFKRIADTINAIVPEGEWAFTGSVAVWLHGYYLKGIETRTPFDIDVLITNDSFFTLAQHVYRECEKVTKRGAERVFPQEHNKIYKTICPAQMFGTNINIGVDVLKSPYFGRLPRNIVVYDGMPVLSLPQLETIKQIALEDAKEYDLGAYAKARYDLNIIKQLQSKRDQVPLPHQQPQPRPQPKQRRQQRRQSPQKKQQESMPKLQWD